MRVLFLTIPIILIVGLKSFGGINEASLYLASNANFARDEHPAQVKVGSFQFAYDPLVIAAVASLESRTPDARANDWFEHELPAQLGTGFCPESIKAYIRRSRTRSKYTFILLPGSYSTFYFRSYVNKTAGILASHFDDPTLIAFDGFITSEFLEGRCVKIPWDINALGADLYSRLRHLLQDLKARPNSTGVIGYSGGASLAMSMLAADTGAAQTEKEFKLGLGGIAASPLLHPRTVFENLDTARKSVTKNRDTAFTTYDVGNLRFFLQNWGQPTWQQITAIAAKKPADFRRRYFNEFVIVDLKTTLSALGRPVPDNETLSYSDVYIKNGFANDRPDLAPNDLANAFDRETDISQTISRIRQPLLIHFAKDDPNNSNFNGSEQPKAVQAVVDFAKTRSNVIMLNPTFGGHVSIILEPNYGELIENFFKEPSVK